MLIFFIVIMRLKKEKILKDKEGVCKSDTFIDIV